MPAKQGKLDPALKAAWLADLESGEHKQFQGGWGNSNGPNRCCLNVLAQVSGPRVQGGSSIDVWPLLMEKTTRDLINANDDDPGDNYARVCAYIRENL